MADRTGRDRLGEGDSLQSTAVLGGEQQHLLDYVRVLHKRRWLVLTTFVLIVALVGLHTATTTPLYEARVQLLIEDERPNVVIFKDAVDTDKGSLDYYQTQYRILQSESMARRTLDRLKLWDHPEF